MCMFCRSWFVLLYFFFWPLCCCLSSDIRILSIPERSRVHLIKYRRFQWYHCVDTVDGGLLEHDGIIRPLVGVLALTWCIRYTYCRNLQFVNIELLLKLRFNRVWLSCLGKLVVMLLNALKLFGFSILSDGDYSRLYVRTNLDIYLRFYYEQYLNNRVQSRKK